MMKKRILAVLLCICMLCALLPTWTFAASDDVIGRTAKITPNGLLTLWKDPTNDGDQRIVGVSSLPETVRIISVHHFSDTITVYGVEGADGTWPEAYSAYRYINSMHITLEEEEPIPSEPSEPTQPTEPTQPPVSEDELVDTSAGTAISVKGEVPEGTQLSVSKATVDPAEFGIADASSILVALDMQLLDSDGNVWQPYEAGAEVEVAIDAQGLGLADGDVVTLHHKHADTIETYDPYVVIGGKLTFWTDRFSTYVVSGLRVQDRTTQIGDGTTYTMKVGETAVFWGDYAGGSRAVWQVEDKSSAINYQIVGLNNNTQKSWAQWIEVEAKDTGRVALTFQHYSGSTNPHTFYIEIINPDATLFVDDDVAESGCLLPAWKDLAVDLTGVSYEWTRSDGIAVSLQALETNGGINISLDRGGVTNASTPITYTVTAKGADGTVIGEASYEVLYGNEILNPGFENPNDISGGYTTYYNGYPGLYWKTTAPGTGGNLLKDIEIGHEYNNPYGIREAAEGSRFAELNAENFGTLYQDMLTTPGAELNWAFSHTKRGDSPSDDIMYVIVAATEHAQEIVNAADIVALLDAAKTEAANSGKTIPTNVSGFPEGLAFTYNGGDYRIWKSIAKTTASSARNWVQVSGTYQVPDGQYLTRLFFASEATAGSNPTYGNMIDGVSAGEFMSYTVEYYNEDRGLMKTEGNEKISAYTKAPLQYLAGYLEEYNYPAKILINGRDYPGTVADLESGLYITSYGQKTPDITQPQDIVLQIYFHSPNIVVTKVVQTIGMSNQELHAILQDGGFSAEFELTNGGDTYNADVTIEQTSTSGVLTAEDSFVDDEGNYLTAHDYGREFTVSESACTEIDRYTVTQNIKVGYSRDAMAEGNKVKIEDVDGKRVAFVEVTNTYAKQIGNLTIRKDGANLDTDENQSFLFKVTGPDDFEQTVVVRGNSGVIIKDLPIGETYTITEITDWSWRYAPADEDLVTQQVTIDADSTKNVVDFVNTREKGQWLGGDNWVVNIFKRETIDQLFGKELRQERN